MVEDLRVLQRVRVLDGETGDVVEDHVHDANRPDGAIRILPIQGEVVRVFALFLQILVALDEETTRAHRGIVNLLTRLRFD